MGLNIVIHHCKAPLLLSFTFPTLVVHGGSWWFHVVPFTHPNASERRVTVSGPTEKAVKAARDDLEFITAGAIGFLRRHEDVKYGASNKRAKTLVSYDLLIN